MCKCKRCGRELRSEASVKRGYGPTCFRIVSLQKSEPEPTKPDLSSVVVADLLDRVRKIELDNTFMKYQLKHKHFSVTKNSDINLEWDRIKPEVKEVINEFKGVFGGVVKELRTLFEEHKSILITDFRFTDKELGIKPIEVK